MGEALMKTHLLSLSPAEFCNQTNACLVGAEFAGKFATMRDVWDASQRVDWLVWMIKAIDAPQDEKTCRLFMVWCARHTPLADGRTTVVLLSDPHSLAALDVAERFANGNATREDLLDVRSAAWSAAESAAWSIAESAAWSAARSAAWSAARSAAWSAAESAAWSAAESAVRSAAWSAAWSAAGSVAWSAAESAACSAQATQFRKMVANPFTSQK